MEREKLFIKVARLVQPYVNGVVLTNWYDTISIDSRDGVVGYWEACIASQYRALASLLKLADALGVIELYGEVEIDLSEDEKIILPEKIQLPDGSWVEVE